MAIPMTSPVGGAGSSAMPMSIPQTATNIQTAPGSTNTQQPMAINAQATSAASSSTSVNSQVQTFMATYGAQSSSQMVNLILLMAAMKFLSGGKDDKDENDSMMGLMLMAMMQQQQQQEMGMVMYSSQSLSVETSSSAVSSASVNAVYGGGMDGYGGGSGVDVSA